MTYQPASGNADRSERRAEVEAKVAELGVDGTGDVVIRRERVFADPGIECPELARAADDAYELARSTRDPELAAKYFQIAHILEQRYHVECPPMMRLPNSIGGEILPG
ncbi:MAG TPA: hypothetical protein VNA20_08505 [Frankiaceae bacterium]|nr:hypothetical protein [Frankiaceae bacterium]